MSTHSSYVSTQTDYFYSLFCRWVMCRHIQSMCRHRQTNNIVVCLVLRVLCRPIWSMCRHMSDRLSSVVCYDHVSTQTFHVSTHALKFYINQKRKNKCALYWIVFMLYWSNCFLFFFLQDESPEKIKESFHQLKLL